MALYYYEAFSKSGKKVRGTLDAPTAQSVKEQLMRQSLFPIKIEPAQLEKQGNLLQRLLRRNITVKEKILFTKQLATLLRSGIPLLQSMELLTDQFEGYLRSMLVSIKDDLKQGSAFADALQKYPGSFENIYVQLVRAGEATGQLEVILDRLVQYLQRKETLRKQVMQAIRWPLIQLIAVGLIASGLIIFAVPQLAENFATVGQELPLATRIVLGISDFITGHYILLPAFIITIIFLFIYWRSTPTGKWQWDKIKLKLPLVKFLSKTRAIVQFSYTLGMLLESGVHLAQALDIVVSIIDNQILAAELREARENIIREGKIAQYLKRTGIFPPIAIYLIETGEQSGKLDGMLLHVAQMYEKETEEVLDRLTSALQPIIMVILALVVGFVVIAIALPIFKMGELAGV